MTDTLVHRGPDDAGYWYDPQAGVALGHRRLSIVDLSPTGHQPMVSACGRYVLSFNGEIYNHRALRAELEARGHVAGAWKGTSDTEVALAAFTAWGIEKAIRRFVGMFALAVWDREARTLKLARDRAGEKPLYYGWFGNTVVFASELRALRAHPSWAGTISRVALARYCRYGYVPAPLSIYEGIYKVLPASIAVVRCNDAEHLRSQASKRLPEEQYWSPEADRRAPPKTLAEAVDTLQQLLDSAIREQMVADVPVGAFLSGGIDSSTVVALMQRASGKPVRTFTIGFRESSHNEAEYAKAVAIHLKTQHTEHYVSPSEARDVIPLLPIIYDEPFADSSQIPTFLVSRLARREVTVSLSGDGGDELFGGYPRYDLAEKVWRASRLMPRSAVKWTGRIAERVLSAVGAPQRMLRLAGALQAVSPYEFYQYFISHIRDPALLAADPASDEQVEGDSRHDERDFGAYLMRLDLTGYLPDDILVKVDRAAMANSLETRIPLLDHRIIAFARSLPRQYRVNGSQTKWILRQLLYRYVPPELVERPKMGFGIPVAAWLRGPLREWAEDLLDAKRMAQEGLLNPDFVRAMWHAHQDGHDYWQYSLWDVLMFQSWLRQTARANANSVGASQEGARR